MLDGLPEPRERDPPKKMEKLKRSQGGRGDSPVIVFPVIVLVVVIVIEKPAETTDCEERGRRRLGAEHGLAWRAEKKACGLCLRRHPLATANTTFDVYTDHRRSGRILVHYDYAPNN